jgi:hypothetical protein
MPPNSALEQEYLRILTNPLVPFPICYGKSPTFFMRPKWSDAFRNLLKLIGDLARAGEPRAATGLLPTYSHSIWQGSTGVVEHGCNWKMGDDPPLCCKLSIEAGEQLNQSLGRRPVSRSA